MHAGRLVLQCFQVARQRNQQVSGTPPNLGLWILTISVTKALLVISKAAKRHRQGPGQSICYQG